MKRYFINAPWRNGYWRCPLSEGQNPIAITDHFIQILHGRNRTQVGAAGIADLQAGAAGQNPAAPVRELPHLFGHLELVGVEIFALHALGEQKHPDRVALFEGEHAEAECVPRRFGIRRMQHYAQFHFLPAESQNQRYSQYFSYKTLPRCSHRLGGLSLTCGAGAAKKSPPPKPARPSPISTKHAPWPRNSRCAPLPVTARAILWATTS